MYSVEFFASALGFRRGVPFTVNQVTALLGFHGAVSLRAVMTQPRLPISLSPVGTGSGSGIPIVNVELGWEDHGVPGYNQATKFIVSLLPNSGSPIPEILSPQTTYTIPNHLLFQQNYQWSVQSVNDHGSSMIANATFVTVDMPPPTNLAPNETDTVLVPVVLTWVDPGAEMGNPALQFEIQITGVFDNPGILITKTFHCQQSSFTVPEVLFPDERYKWSVKSCFVLPVTNPVNCTIPSEAQFATQHQ